MCKLRQTLVFQTKKSQLTFFFLFSLSATFREEDKNIFDYCRENNIDHVSEAISSQKVDVNTKDEEVPMKPDSTHMSELTLEKRTDWPIRSQWKQQEGGSQSTHYSANTNVDVAKGPWLTATEGQN